MKLFITPSKGFSNHCLPYLPHHSQITISSCQASKPLCRFSRRDVVISIISSAPLLHLITSTPFKAIAEETNQSQITDSPTQQEEEPTPTGLTSDSPPITKKPPLAFLDISIDGQQVGRITIAIDASEAPSGASRFTNLISGKPGVSYRRKEFIKIMPNYIQHGGVRSYGETGVDELVLELERSGENASGSTKNIAGSVGILVRDPSKPPPKMKLVAKRGKLEIDSEEVGVSPNGTEFVISTRDAPELDKSNLVIGRVVDGMDVVERISQVKTVQENSSSPYFRVAKLIGDKRAIVAERGFNRPYSKIVVTNCGLID
ncbi:hypothetical protein Scep_022450 [Stephania cephalantha]|uniref:PPIase cyclophilin-type domain-containing protein n=1 Tax=Stephania cephalantha TaxID=152367 RepID=A0AAP0F5E9_9MAGN